MTCLVGLAGLTLTIQGSGEVDDSAGDLFMDPAR
jgi:hypothetical protein